MPKPSLREILVNLDIGESHVVAKRLNQDDATSESIADAKESIHNVSRSAMARATTDTGNVYTGETGDFRTTRGHHPVLLFVITRTA